jgi:hypothetical protein
MLDIMKSGDWSLEMKAVEQDKKRESIMEVEDK